MRPHEQQFHNTNKGFSAIQTTTKWLNSPIPFNLKLSPQVGEWGGSHALGLAPPLLVSHSHPGPMNKEGFVQRMNGDSFLLGILLKLESRGLLPLMTTKGSQQPNLRTQLVSTSHLAAAEAWGVGQEGFSSVTEQLKILWATPGNTTQGLWQKMLAVRPKWSGYMKKPSCMRQLQWTLAWKNPCPLLCVPVTNDSGFCVSHSLSTKILSGGKNQQELKEALGQNNPPLLSYIYPTSLWWHDIDLYPHSLSHLYIPYKHIFISISIKCPLLVKHHTEKNYLA